MLQGGSFVIELLEKAGKGGRPGVSRPKSGALLVSTDLTRIDTLMFFEGVETEAVDAPWGGLYGVEPPLAKRTLIATQPNAPKICFGDLAFSEIRCVGPDFTRFSAKWTTEPVAVEDWEVQLWRDTSARMFAGKVSESAVLEMLDQVSVPRVRPAFSRLIIDVVGNIWVEQKSVNWADASNTNYLVFTPYGILLGLVAVPPVEVLEVGEDYVLGVYRDVSDVEYVKVLSLIKPQHTDRTM